MMTDIEILVLVPASWEVGMSCLSCGSKKQAEFPAEMLIHFEGLKNLDKPGVWVFPKLLVCLDCGFFQSTIPASELASLVAGSSEIDRVLRRMFDELGEK
jgi:hypothetical protein